MLSCCFLVSCGNRTVLIGPGFWNIRSPFIIGGNNIGTHMSLIQLANGKFLIIDTVDVDAELKGEIDNLTSNGTLMVAVLATHPYHTTYFPTFYKLYPNVPYYGTPRHLKIEPTIPWVGTTWDCDTRQKWLPEVEFRIPRGSDFESDGFHFSGIHVFHPRSKTIHVDDTIGMTPKVKLEFHPSLRSGGLYHIPESPPAFHDWVQKYINEWDFENICAAHNGVKLVTAKPELQSLLDSRAQDLVALAAEYALTPSATDEAKFKAMDAHEAMCKE